MMSREKLKWLATPMRTSISTPAEMLRRFSLSSTLYKSTTVGLYGKLYNTKPVGGASCPAVTARETATDFFNGQAKKPDG